MRLCFLLRISFFTPRDLSGGRQATGVPTATVHRDVNPNATSIEEREFPKEFCLGCHGSYANLIVLTKDSTALSDIADTVVNPHDSHQGEVDCYNCHKMHRTVKPINYCYTCH